MLGALLAACGGGGDGGSETPVAVKLLFLTEPSDAVAGAPLSPPVRVGAADAGGAVVTTFTGNITITVPGGAQSITGTPTQTANAGVATFADLHVSPAGLQVALEASAPGLTAATSQGFDLSAPAPTRLAFVVAPSQAGAGDPLSPAVVVAAQDAGGLTATSFTGSITVTISNPRGAVLEGTSTIAAVAGLATFTDLNIKKAATNYKLVANGTGLQSATSAGFPITPLAASQILFTSIPSAAVAANNFGSSVMVKLRDPFDNLATGFNGNVSLTIGANPSSGVLDGAPSATASAGVSVFSDLRIDRPGDGYTLLASVAGIPNKASPSFDVTPLTFVDLQAGSGLTCGVTPTGAGLCWGLGASGELGNGQNSNRNKPTQVSGGIQWRAIYPTAAAACGISTGGVVYCWGESMTNGPPTNTPQPASPGFVFDSLTVGATHVCAHNAGSPAFCWGRNNLGELGDGTVNLRAAPTAVLGGLSFRSLSAGTEYTCGIAVNQDAYCWGQGANGQTGDGMFFSNPHQPALVLGGLKFLSVHAASIHTCGIATSGAGYCWGDDSFGQLGDGAFTPHAQPVPVGGGLTFISIDGATNLGSGGETHTCGVATSGTAYCWGHPADGVLGDGSTMVRADPGAVSGSISFQSVTTGFGLNTPLARHSCGLSSTGTAYCWGYNVTGALGDGTNSQRSVPTLVLGGVP